MTILFWLFWSLDFLFAAFALWGAGFRSSFGAGTALNTWIVFGLAVVLAGSLVLRFGFKLRLLSLCLVAAPLAAALVASLFDSQK